MNTKALRQKILDLAIHGKLVPQDPNDEPASVLLERIKAEKERLIKEGKIKRTKRSKAACDKPHYENEEPFDIPSSWTWTTVNDINMYNSKNVNPAKHKENIFELYSVPVFPTDTPEIVKGGKIGSAKQCVENGDVLLCKINPKINRVWFVKNRTENAMIASSEWIVVRNKFMLTDYLVFCFMSPYFRDLIENNVSGVGGSLTRAQPSMVATYTIPIPPFQEQERIVEEIKHWFELIDVIEQSKEALQEVIKLTKSKILDLAIHGKLVPQDPNEEPATELLKRINPKAEITCDNPHYRKLPKGWVECRLEDIVEYEQPTAYIVSSTDYDDSYPIPVLTAGKSFLIGHTNDDEGIFSNIPCIIFDDFTTDSKLVNFPFKVKSSAMKILKVHKNVDIEYVASFMSITRLIGDTHKRYWISEYSKLEIPLPPYKEQVRIMNQIKLLFERLDSIIECL